MGTGIKCEAGGEGIQHFGAYMAVVSLELRLSIPTFAEMEVCAAKTDNLSARIDQMVLICV